MKQIRIEFLSYLSRNHTNGIFLLVDKTTVRDVLETYGLVHGEVGLILVNGELTDEGHILPDGALVRLYPMFNEENMR